MTVSTTARRATPPCTTLPLPCVLTAFCSSHTAFPRGHQVPHHRERGRGESWLTAAIPMDNPYCSCKLTRVRSRGRWTSCRRTTPPTTPGPRPSCPSHSRARRPSVRPSRPGVCTASRSHSNTQHADPPGNGAGPTGLNSSTVTQYCVEMPDEPYADYVSCAMGGSSSHRRDCISAAPPSACSRRFNKDAEGASAI